MQELKEEDIQRIEIDLLLEALFQRYGYDFREYAMASIRRRVRHLMLKSGCAHPSELIPRLLHDHDFAQKAILEFSISVTEMFRDPSFYVAVRNKVLPYLMQAPTTNAEIVGCGPCDRPVLRPATGRVATRAAPYGIHICPLIPH